MPKRPIQEEEESELPQWLEESDVVGFRDGIPVVKNKSLIRLGIISSPTKKTKSASKQVKKSNKSTSKQSNKTIKGHTKIVNGEERKASAYDIFNEALKRYKNANKVSISMDQKKEAWMTAKDLMDSDRLRPTFVGFSQFFSEVFE